MNVKCPFIKVPSILGTSWVLIRHWFLFFKLSLNLVSLSAFQLQVLIYHHNQHEWKMSVFPRGAPRNQLASSIYTVHLTMHTMGTKDLNAPFTNQVLNLVATSKKKKKNKGHLVKRHKVGGHKENSSSKVHQAQSKRLLELLRRSLLGRPELW